MAFKYHVVEGKNLKTGAAIFFAMAGLLGTFRTSIKSNAVPSQELFNGDCIERINLRFQPSPTMKYLLKASNPELNFVQTDPNE